MTAARRLGLGAIVVVSVTTYMAVVGAQSSWQYYLTVDECLLSPPPASQRAVRVSGDVLPGSLIIGAERRSACFDLAGTQHPLRVQYRGTVPPNLSESKPVVVEGHLSGTSEFQAHQVLTRCASKYVARADRLAQAGTTP